MSCKYKKFIIPAVIILQFFWIIVSVLMFEINLETGKSIILKIVPVDPRSLMQGDYVNLNYSISDINIDFEASLRPFVRVVIHPNRKGVYNYKSLYSKNMTLDEKDVIIKGTPYGDSIFYGIEHFFVPEGTGRAVERNADYALVKVSAGGNAMLVKLLTEDDLRYRRY